MKELWINGEWLPGETSVVIKSPFDGASIGEVAVAFRAQVALAVEAAERAKPAMRALSAYERGEILDKVADLFTEHRNEAAAILSAEAAKKLQGGDPGKTTTDYSALISEKDARRVHQWIKDAEAAGAAVLCGGELTGNMVAPAILTNVARGVKVSCQEVFGPVVVISPFDTLDEAIDQVNDSVYGLQAGIYTPLLDNALHAARKLEVGGVMINDIPTFRVDQMPYGGVKESGIGREGLRYAVAEMTEMKLVVVKPGK